MSRVWRLRAVIVIVVGAAIELVLVLAGMGPRVLLVGAIVALLGAIVCLALDLGDSVVAVEWPSTTQPSRSTDGVEWRVGTIRILLMNDRRSDGASNRLRDLLVGLIDDRLVAKHRIDRETDPVVAAVVIGDELSAFVAAPVPVRSLSDRRQVARIVTLIEAL